MKKHTTSVYARPNSKGDKLNLTIRYTYNRERHPFSTSYTVAVKDWDSKNERVLKSEPNFCDINNALKKLDKDLNSIADSLIKQDKEPTVEAVKDKYSYFQNLEKSLAEANEQAKPVLIQKAKVYRSEIEELQARIKMLEAKERKNLRHAGALPENEPVEETSDYSKLEALVKEYFKVKTGEPWKPKPAGGKKKTVKSSGTARGLRSWCKTFLEFNASGHAKKYKIKLDLSVLDTNYYNAYAAFLMSPSGHNYFNNTFGAHVKKLKTFLGWVAIDKQMSIDKRYTRFKVLTEEKEIICFNKSDIDLLYTFKPKAPVVQKKIELQKYIDFTVFSFLSGLRISDVKKAKGLRLLVKDNGARFITSKTTKTKNVFLVPLAIDYRLEEILNKYNWDLNFFTDTEYNRTIKDLLAEFCEEHQLHQKEISITRYKLDKATTTTHTFSELYSSHCNRRGFVCYAYTQLKYRIEQIMKIIGTTSEKEIRKYLKLEAEDLLDNLEQVPQMELVA